MFSFFHKEKTKIKAVSDEDLVSYLKSLGVYKIIEKGEARCKFCGTQINLDNLQALFPCKEDVCFVCSNIKCLSKVSS